MYIVVVSPFDIIGIGSWILMKVPWFQPLAGGLGVGRCSVGGDQLHRGIPRAAAASWTQAPLVKPRVRDVRVLAIYHERVLIRATMSFGFALNDPAFGIETCQEPNDLAEQIEKNRAINCKGIHFVVNTGACCEKQDCTQTALPCKSQSMCWQSILLNPCVSLDIS